MENLKDFRILSIASSFGLFYLESIDHNLRKIFMTGQMYPIETAKITNKYREIQIDHSQICKPLRI